ncbi:LysR family transcriptional regulator [Paraoerskovia sediminicola]|uniref:LysR family transcriptional regulator n=1 Tax=Paraoerskovia sediminicola TaxID=1138587 RepID=A0ABM8G161_9CELL|nr:LysR family transcriptional regulator [Paraoerskovia sediminicola]BDZ41794.1 LysR family transcriptional regulator [Paraoerskovia sediminicola]
MPSLRALSTLIAVVDHGSITAAARALHLSQPAVSQQLTALEREVGTPLLERLPRGVRPTAAGAAMLADARAALAAVERSVDAGQAVARGEAGRLRVAVVESMTAPVVAPVLREWLARRPEVDLDIVESTSADDVARLLDTEQADLGIGPRSPGWTGRRLVVGREEIHVVLPGQPRVGRPDGPDLEHPPPAAPVTWDELAAGPVVHYHPANSLGGWLDAAAARHGVVLRPAVRTLHATTAAALARAGLGPALVPASALAPGGWDGVRHLAPRLRREIVVMVANDGDGLARSFADAVVARGAPRVA